VAKAVAAAEDQRIQDYWAMVGGWVGSGPRLRCGGVSGVEAHLAHPPSPRSAADTPAAAACPSGV
jgi:hypothetical protein